MTDTGATPQSAEDRPRATAPSLVALAWTAAAGLGVPLGLWLSGPTDGSDVGLDDHAATVRRAVPDTVSMGPPIASFVCDSGGDWPRVEVATRRHRLVTDAVRCTSPALETAIDHIGGGSLWFGLIPTWAGPAKIEVEHRGGDRQETTANIAYEVRHDGGQWRALAGTSDAVGALRDGGVDGFPWTSTHGIVAPRSGRYEFRAVIHAVVETGSVVHLRNVQLVVTTIEGDLPGCGLARAPKDCPLARRLLNPSA